MPVVVVIAGLLTARWLWDELRRGPHANPAKRLYVASTAALFVTILVNPIAGFLGYVGSHAVEYFIIVHQSIGPRYASVDVDGGAPVGHAVRRLGRLGFFGVYLGLIIASVALLDRYGGATVYASSCSPSVACTCSTTGSSGNGRAPVGAACSADGPKNEDPAFSTLASTMPSPIERAGWVTGGRVDQFVETSRCEMWAARRPRFADDEHGEELAASWPALPQSAQWERAREAASLIGLWLWLRAAARGLDNRQAVRHRVYVGGVLLAMFSRRGVERCRARPPRCLRLGRASLRRQCRQVLLSLPPEEGC